MIIWKKIGIFPLNDMQAPAAHKSDQKVCEKFWMFIWSLSIFFKKFAEFDWLGILTTGQIIFLAYIYEIDRDR